MKKITLLALLFVCSISFGQNRAESVVEAVALGENVPTLKTVVETPQTNKLPEGITSVSELIASGYVFDKNTSGQTVSSSVITPVGKSSGGIAVYNNRAAFQAACGGSLIFEDFGGGPGGISACGTVISNAGDFCFTPGEIQVGIEISPSDLGNVTAYFDAGSGPLLDTGVGSNTFVDFTVIEFPNNDVDSFGADFYTVFNNANVDIRIYGTGGLIDTFSSPINNPTFLGFISSEIIVRMEIEDLTLGEAEFVAQVAFGSCPLSVEDILAELVSVYPNPTQNELTVSIPSSIEVEGSAMYDITGRNTGIRLIDGTMNTSSLSSGIYFLELNTSSGTLTKKIIKN